VRLYQISSTSKLEFGSAEDDLVNLDSHDLNRIVARRLTPYIRILDQIRVQYPTFLSWRERAEISIKLTKIERIIVTVQFNKRRTQSHRHVVTYGRLGR
jgi:hypothetical protein